MQLQDLVEHPGPARQEAGEGTKGKQAEVIDYGDFNVSNAHN